MTDNRRRYQRTTVEQKGEIEVRVQNTGPGSSSRRIRLPALIRSLSPEGVGLQVEAVHSFVPDRGRQITTLFSIGERHFELPGKIAWFTKSKGPNPRFDIGIHLRLELAIASVRHSYATWIVAQSRR